MWNLKTKQMNKETKEKQIHKHREETDGCHREGERGMGKIHERGKN